MAMKISTKGRYALRLMLDLALHDTGEYIPLKEVAAGRRFPINILNKSSPSSAAPALSKASAAPQGGYRLAESPAQYTVGRILRLMEGSLAPVECVDGEGDCSRADRCVTIEVWRALKEAIDNVVDSITLADLVEKYSERGAVDYCI